MTTTYTYNNDNLLTKENSSNGTSSGVPTDAQKISYTSFGRPNCISEKGNSLIYTYNSNYERAKIESTVDNNAVTKLSYANGKYRRIRRGNKTIQRLYLGGDAYTAFAVLERKDKNNRIYYLHRDYLGSITGITDSEGNLQAEYSYTAWGRLRNPKSWEVYAVGNEPMPMFGRGYTGHEHLSAFGLINMNARLYDAGLGRFLSPDPFVQSPDFSQNFNRYSYALNNPLKYTDPDGEFFLGTILTFLEDLIKTAFFDGGLDPTSKTARRNAWKDFDPTASWSATNKAWKIDIGGFKTDPNRTIVGRGLQLLSRWTWEVPQTVLGKAASHSRNWLGQVDNVDYYGGATLVNDDDPSYGGRWGFTLGPYINSKNIVADPNVSEIFRHEYGHTLQSRLVGPLYLTHVALPSLIGSGLEDLGLNVHNREWYETQANRMAFRYFNNHDNGALTTLPWDDNEYPREYNPNWYWFFTHPPLPFMWCLFF